MVDAEALDAVSGAARAADEPLAEVGGASGVWLREARAFRDRLRTAGTRVPAATDLLTESRKGR